MKRAKEYIEKDPLAIYLSQITAYPLLTKKEEQELGKTIVRHAAALDALEEEYQKSGVSRSDYIFQKEVLQEKIKSGKHRMITSNLRLVVSIAKKFQHQGLGLLDLINEGNIGLMEAVERYDYSRGCRFSTYGTWWIQQAVIKALADKGRPIRIPIHALNLVKKYYSVRKLLTQDLGRTPRASEIAVYMRIPEEKVAHLAHISQDTSSLESTIDGESMTSLMELICKEDYVTPFESAFLINLQKQIFDHFEMLKEREKKILELRFGLNGEGPLTLEGIGTRFGITRERVRQIQNNAMRKLRGIEAIQELKEYI